MDREKNETEHFWLHSLINLQGITSTLLQESGELSSLFSRKTTKLADVWFFELCAGTLFVLLLKFGAVLSIICGYEWLFDGGFLVGGFYVEPFLTHPYFDVMSFLKHIFVHVYYVSCADWLKFEKVNKEQFEIKDFLIHFWKKKKRKLWKWLKQYRLNIIRIKQIYIFVIFYIFRSHGAIYFKDTYVCIKYWTCGAAVSQCLSLSLFEQTHMHPLWLNLRPAHNTTFATPPGSLLIFILGLMFVPQTLTHRHRECLTTSSCTGNPPQM